MPPVWNTATSLNLSEYCDDVRSRSPIKVTRVDIRSCDVSYELSFDGRLDHVWPPDRITQRQLTGIQSQGYSQFQDYGRSFKQLYL
jgi:hypothetical protein